MSDREENTCECCGKEYGPIPPGAWMATIGGWHTVYIGTPNDPNTALGYDNDPAKAASSSWRKYDRLIAEMRKES